jgi:hypothetical protein
MLKNIRYMIKSLYDKKIALEFVRKDSSKGVGYFFLFAIMIMITISLNSYYTGLRYVYEEMEPMVKNFPTMEIKDGMARFANKKKIRDEIWGKNKQLSIKIDTNMKARDYEGSGSFVFIGKDFFSYRYDRYVESLSKVKDTTINADMAVELFNKFKYAAMISTNLFLLGFFTFIVMLNALIVKFVAKMVSIKFNFREAFKTAVIALAPATLLIFLLSLVVSPKIMLFVAFAVYTLISLYFFWVIDGKKFDREAVIEVDDEDKKTSKKIAKPVAKKTAKKEVKKGKK